MFRRRGVGLSLGGLEHEKMQVINADVIVYFN